MRPCNVCGKTKREAILRCPRGTVYRCEGCTIYYVDEQLATPAQERLFYSTIDENSYRAYFEPFRSGQYRYALQKLSVPIGATLLDVGASYGWLVKAAHSLGFDSYGLEPGEAAYSDDLQGRIFRASLEEFSKASNTEFDVVTIWHVLEHLSDPMQATALMRNLLKPGGVLLVAVPTTDGRLFQLAELANKVFGSQKLMHELFYFKNPNMHFFYPNKKSLRILLERSEFCIESMETIEAFDWQTIFVRGGSRLSRLALRMAGPMIKLSRLTAAENLITVARKN